MPAAIMFTATVATALAETTATVDTFEASASACTSTKPA